MVRQVKWTGLVALVILAGLCAVWSGARAQEDQPAAGEKAATKKGGPMMMACPMMACLGDIKLHADCPALLLAKTEDLKLSDAQKQQLHEIEESARKQARAVLTADQREKLKDAPEGLMSMMQVCMMQHRAMMMGGKGMMMGGKKGQMCPNCMKMMRHGMMMNGKMGHGHKADQGKSQESP